MTGCLNSDTAGAYLLGALPQDEAYAFELHLAGCPMCQHDVHRLEGAAGALGTAVPVMQAPPELGWRIKRIVHSEAELLRAAGPEADRLPGRQPRRGLRLRPRLALGSTLAAGALAGLAVGAIVIGGGSSSTPTQVIHARILQASLAPGARANLAITNERGTLSVNNFPSPPRGRVYEVWLVGPGSAPRPTDALFSVSSDGSGTVAVPGSLRGVHEILVTDEPDGGSQKPTRSPILSAVT